MTYGNFIHSSCKDRVPKKRSIALELKLNLSGGRVASTQCLTIPKCRSSRASCAILRNGSLETFDEI